MTHCSFGGNECMCERGLWERRRSGSNNSMWSALRSRESSFWERQPTGGTFPNGKRDLNGKWQWEMDCHKERAGKGTLIQQPCIHKHTDACTWSPMTSIQYTRTYSPLQGMLPSRRSSVLSCVHMMGRNRLKPTRQNPKREWGQWFLLCHLKVYLVISTAQYILLSSLSL